MLTFINKYIKPEINLLILIALICAVPLFSRLIIGVANNGDFYRVFEASGLGDLQSSLQEPYASYVNTEYLITKPILSISKYFVTTQRIPVYVAKLANYLFYSKLIFDIRFLSSVYYLIFLISLYIIIKTLKSNSNLINYCAGLILIFVLCDYTYIAYFNSFYGEPAGYVFLLLFLASGLILIRNEKDLSIGNLILFFCCGFVFLELKFNICPCQL